jgi:hypothetical protein
VHSLYCFRPLLRFLLLAEPPRHHISRCKEKVHSPLLNLFTLRFTLYIVHGQHHAATIQPAEQQQQQPTRRRLRLLPELAQSRRMDTKIGRLNFFIMWRMGPIIPAEDDQTDRRAGRYGEGGGVGVRKDKRRKESASPEWRQSLSATVTINVETRRRSEYSDKYSPRMTTSAPNT